MGRGPHRLAMEPELQIATPHPRRPVFAISCWVLGAVIFCQLLIGGLALATRFEDSKIVRTVVREVPKLIAVRTPAVAEAPPVPVEAMSLPAPLPVTAPKIDDPKSERMVIEARQARVAGDMGVAVMKLEEALQFSPDDPSVHYEMGLVHEQMGVFDTAAAHYEKVFQAGVSGSGALYELAATKLRDGFEEPSARGLLALGRVRIYKDPNNELGQVIILTIPVQKAPGETIDVADIAVSVTFFNRSAKNEIVQLEDKSWVSEQWTSMPFDWAGGEEYLRMTYTIPAQDEQTEHLFGERTYYGQVVSLLCKGEVVDVQAWPRDLAARMSKPETANPFEPVPPEFQDSFPPEFESGPGVLPPLPSR